VLVFGAASCSENDKSKVSKEEKKTRKKLSLRKKPVTVLQIRDNGKEKKQIGDTVVFDLSALKNAPAIDSVVWLVNGIQKERNKKAPFNFSLSTANMGVGKQLVAALSYLADSTRDRRQERFELFADISPKLYSYQIVNEYPHDANAWTQGLLFEDGVLYEGTGLKGSSSLRKVAVSSGEILQFRELEATLFGEGIVTFDNEIYQLTYQSQVGKVYDKETFQFKRDFQYATEGWGLTTDGTHLIMSDGSNILYFMDPSAFTEVKRIEIYDDESSIDQLNELEYINEEIYANIWQTDFIVRIDPQSGIVLGKIDFSGLREKAITPQKGDVLNGIAYDKQNNRLFVTGKWWNKLFEVRLIEK
ncbi:MAG: glutaminyl-peptide cyclotransferase, partial [Bacteroidota bacterium]